MQIPFSSLALSPALQSVIAELGYEHLTPIQAGSIPVLLAGTDLIGQSKTGSGKTAAFALPLLEKLALESRELQALVLCPTRELCTQVARELRKLGRRHPGLAVLAVCGGEPLQKQTRALKSGAHVIVATPGRLLDHVGRHNVDFARVTTVVLDEADRMLDMGFQADMETILKALPKPRQTAFFSATFSDSIQAMSRAHQCAAVRITIEEPEQVQAEIRQLVWSVQPDEKLGALCRILVEHAQGSALIFCNQKLTVIDLDRTLAAARVSVDCLHGELEQWQRDQVLARFRNQSVRLLVATDVAARGLDVEDMDLVVNYDLPSQPETYVHRIGRTGRAGKPGLSISLATARDRDKIAEIERYTGQSLEQAAPPPGTKPTAPTKELAGEAKMATIHIAGGRKDKLRPSDILGALTGEAGGLSGDDIGKIEIHDHLTFVAVAIRMSQKAVSCLEKGRIKGKRFRARLVTREHTATGTARRAFGPAHHQSSGQHDAAQRPTGQRPATQQRPASQRPAPYRGR